MPGGFGAFILRPDALPDANPPLFPGMGPAQWCAGLHTTEAEEHLETTLKSNGALSRNPDPNMTQNEHVYSIFCQPKGARDGIFARL